MNESKPKAPAWFTLLAFMIVAGVGYYIIKKIDSVLEPPSSPDTAEQRLKDFKAFDAYYASQGFIKQQLLSPSTAEFEQTAEQATEQLNDSTWAIDSYVDSQNTFGAMIRKRYVCRIEYHPSTDSVYCKNATLLPRL
jgi:hypothetical protein